jgi:redox-sensitive bicupin YhaK (pirin superfamily)
MPDRLVTGRAAGAHLFSGQLLHRDSLGSEQVIRPGEVNWMTAGRGIAHSERMGKIAADSAGLELIQTWVALPEKEEESSPTFRNYPADQLPVSMDNGVWMKLIAGKAYGMQNEVRVNSPLFYLHIRMEQHSIFGLPREYSERAVYIAYGNLEIAGINYHQGQMLVFNETENPVIKAQETCTLMLIGGEPLGQRFIWWNFVSSRAERIEEAKEDWKQGRIPLPPNDNKEFIPLPEDVLKPTQQPPKPEPLS